MQLAEKITASWRRDDTRKSKFGEAGIHRRNGLYLLHKQDKRTTPDRLEICKYDGSLLRCQLDQDRI